MKNLFIIILILPILFTSCKILGKEIAPSLILGLVTAIYEIVIRLIPTGTKWLSLIEIVYQFLSWLVPNRATE